MHHIGKRLVRWILCCATVVALGGCARGGDDMYDRMGSHFEWHTLQYWKDAVEINETIDRYFWGLDPQDPNCYGGNPTK
jgi:hypothetical protein